LTTTSGLGSNYTSYTTDPIDASLNSLISDNKKGNFNSTAPGAPSLFLESDIAHTDEYLYVPEVEMPRFMTPQKVNQNYEQPCYGGEFGGKRLLREFLEKTLKNKQVLNFRIENFEPNGKI
jgi:hypothetical protein